MYYYITPNYNVALNAKVGSSTLARIIIRQFYPEQNKKIIHTKTPPHILENDKQWHWLCPGTQEPDKSIVLFVRDPISRFLSACQQINILQDDLDNVIESLINNEYFIRDAKNKIIKEEIKKIDELNEKRLIERNNRILNGHKVKLQFNRIGFIRDDIHFWHQHRYIQHETYCFKFPEQFHNGLQFIGVSDDSVPYVNTAKRNKLTLNNNQLNSVINYYQQDINLFNSITTPGKIFTTGELLCH